MAETVTPSVGGVERVRVVVALLVAGAVSGGVVGLLLGAAWTAFDLPSASAVAAAGVAASAMLLDWAGRPAPPAVRRQVPELWGRIFSPTTAALLYGARLGVGPLTILTTWHWWAATALATTCGPWAGAAAGGAFHGARTITMLVAVAGVGAGAAMPMRMAAVQRGERTVAAAGRLLVALAVVAVLAACSGGDAGTAAAAPSSVESSATTDATTRRRLTSTSTTAAAPSTTSTTTATPEETVLMELLLEEALPGFERAPDLETPDLDLAGAAALERDAEAERALLETRGFVRGTSRAWRAEGRGVVLVTIYEFADDAGATAYLQDGAEFLQAREAQLFDVPEVPGAVGFTQVDETADGSFTGHGVAFTRGARYVLVVAGSSSSGVTVDHARRVATAQAARL